MKFPAHVRNEARRVVSPFRRLTGSLEKIYKRRTSVFFRAYYDWVDDRGDETLRLDYPLNERSIVFDVGGYKGEWAAAIYSRFGSRVLVFEPVPEFANAIKERFEGTAEVSVYPYGLGCKSEILKLSLDADRSSIHKATSTWIDVEIVDIAKYLEEHQISSVDLMKLNIEGAEFELLDRLIDTGKIIAFKDLQVQFHNFVDSAEDRYKALAKRLSKTHKLTWRYPFIWENWRKIDELA